VASVQLREGLTVTVSIIVSSVDNALLVPNAAVTREGQKSYVRVPTAAGGEEKREVKTGISDWQNTVITEGLIDGERVLVPQAQASSSTSTTRPPSGGMFFGAPRR
jgi:multidrug efflux pump subunit AcrA (membrane-fusion protein)